MRTKPIITLLFLFFSISLLAQSNPKREFRGTWIHTVLQSQYSSMSNQQMQKYFDEMLDKLQKAGINALIFQVRPSADAFYASSLEPWSRYLTGEQGVAPTSNWDPMRYLVEACHQRNMEFHAWLNPYRVTVSANDKLSPDHIYFKHPDWFVEYNKKIYFNPGLPQCRKFIRSVVIDILNRYDVDAIHMDDYFYPYPVAGLEFPDEDVFNAYHKVMGFTQSQKEDWRRQNVNILIKGIHDDIQATKPWVRFGISPFGIFRNKKSDPNGSLTNGLQNYDDLYADILLWAKNGWIDYLIPQLYWEIGHKSADYDILVHWWNQNANNIPLYIGQSISRSLDNKQPLTVSDNHFSQKIALTRQLEHIQGNCFWYGYQIMNDEDGISTELQNKQHASKAIIPAYTSIDCKRPDGVKKLKARWTEKGYELQWQPNETNDELQRQVYFCIYRFKKGEKKNLERAENLVATTRDNQYLLPYENGKTRYTYVVTAVDRMHNESKKIKSKKVKL